MEINSQFWAVIKENLKSRNENNKRLETWLDPMVLLKTEPSESGQRLYFGVPNKLHQYWISENLLDLICDEILAAYKSPFEIELVVTGKQNSSTGENPPRLEDFMTEQNSSSSSPSYPRPAEQEVSRDILNSNYVFDTFVVGRSNEFAHAASYNVALNPGSEGYNPLFICGPVGMGKTHLLNAVGNMIRDLHPHLRVCYVSAERFLNECISAIRRGEMEKFRARFRERNDILLVDDVQFLRGEATQEEFFHTLNDFFDRKCQVIVASDRMPKDINGLEDRIRSRLEWGLIADIQMPDIETRVAILRYKAEQLGMRITDDVINHIARISKRSIRELEGNLKKVKMFSELQGLFVDIHLTKKVLANHDQPNSISLEDIQKMVAEHFKIRVADLKSSSRAKPFVVPRQISMFLIKKHLDRSLAEIGRAFGGKDHTTVINALQRIESLQQRDVDLRKDIEDLTNRIHNITGL